MINPKPAGPVGQDFEYLVQELPYWVTRFGDYQDAINRVRLTLKEHESTTPKDKKVRTTF